MKKKPSDGRGPFYCRCHLIVVLKDAELEWTRHVSLPFPPYPGLCLQFTDEATGEDGPDFSPHVVTYAVCEDVFCCYAEEGPDGWCDCGPQDNCCVANEETLAFYEGAGWTLEAQRRGADRHYTIDGMFGEKPRRRTPHPRCKG